MPPSKKTLVVSAGLLLALVATAAGTIRRVGDGELVVARSTTQVRYLPPGFHLINPFRETLDRISGAAFTIDGIASVISRDGIQVRLPFSAEVSIEPRSFAAAMGRLSGQSPRDVVTQGFRDALAVWGSTREATVFLQANPASAVEPPLAQACKEMGIRLEALVLQRPDPEIYVKLAEAALARGEAEAPREFISAALETSPNDPWLIAARGLLAETEGRWDAAREDYFQALALQPGFETPLGRLFVRSQSQGNLAQLEPTLDRALLANPGSVRLQNWKALTHIALERTADAFQTLQAALALDPENEVTLQNLASLYLKVGRPGEASEAYRQAQRANPHSPSILLGLGLAELERGDLSAARTALEAARREGNVSIFLHNGLAEVYRQLGLKEAAAEELLASFRLQPQQPGLRETLTRLLGHPPEVD